mmetsp:Transcript_17842/g.26398  ORF Transcript_17842/g.26398 Transcript_17842/m.26398 type:complete len:276 (-) Transcript_17842:192-1019(-)
MYVLATMMTPTNKVTTSTKRSACTTATPSTERKRSALITTHTMTMKKRVRSSRSKTTWSANSGKFRRRMKNVNLRRRRKKLSISLDHTVPITEETSTSVFSLMMLALTSLLKMDPVEHRYTRSWSEKTFHTHTIPSNLLLLSNVCHANNLRKRMMVITTMMRRKRSELLNSARTLTRTQESVNPDSELTTLTKTHVTTWKELRLFARMVLSTPQEMEPTKLPLSSLVSSLLHLFSLLLTSFTSAPSLIVPPSTYLSKLDVGFLSAMDNTSLYMYL